MGTVRRQGQAKVARRTKKQQTLKAWIERQFLAIPGLRERVDAMMREMLREQDKAARKRKPSGQTKARKRARLR